MKAPVIPPMRHVHLPEQSTGDALVTSFSAGLDRTLMRAVALAVERQLLPREVDLQNLRNSIRSMGDSGLAADPSTFFSFVKPLEQRACAEAIDVLRPKVLGCGARVYRRQMISRYRSLPEFGEFAGEHYDRIAFEHWQHAPGGEKATVMMLHGFAMGWPRVDGRVLNAQQWFELGLNVVLLTLPDHGARRTPGSLLSGQRFTVPHALGLAAAVHQAIHEITELKAWLREHFDTPVGLFGMSLGGYLASLCVGLSTDWDFVIPLVPPACMGDLAWRVYRDTAHHRSGAEPRLTEHEMRAAFFAHSPLAHKRQVARSRILIAAGAGDRIVPPEHPSALWEHWGEPTLHWFRGSHVAPVTGRGMIEAAAAHLNRLGVL